MLPYVEAHPDHSAWELSQISGLDYVSTTRALAKLRELHLVVTVKEERAAGGIRYRYAVVPGWGDVVRGWHRSFIQCGRN
jgi:predicted transcriptional regulator